MKVVASRAWPVFAFIGIIVLITSFFIESIWLDIAFNLSVVITFTFVAIEMFYEDQKSRRWQVIIIGFCVLVFLINTILELISLF